MLLYWILLPIVWPLLHILWRIEVVGKENIPRGRAHVIASNHLSDLDPVYILEAVFSWKRYTILAKQELFKNPLIGWFLSCMGAMPIDRGKGDMGTVNKVTDECKNGTPILIFPEGTRSKTGERGDGGGVAPEEPTATTPKKWQCRCRHGALPHYLRYAG